MIKFDLEKALAGEKVVDEIGREVTQLTEFAVDGGVMPLIGIIDGRFNHWCDDGTASGCHSIFMAPKKLSGFVNVYEDGMIGNMYSTAKDAHESASDNGDRIACIDLSQFEEGYGL